MYLLDTNVVSEIRKGQSHKADVNVIEWADSVPNQRTDRDALIAATAMVHGMAVVTRNVSDFAPTGVEIVNPWLHSESTQ